MNDRIDTHRLAYAAGLALGVVWLAIACMVWHGQVGFARDDLQLGAPLCYLVPVALDGAAAACGFLALRSVMLGDSAAAARAMTAAFVGASVYFNYHHGRQVDLTAARFFGFMSAAAWALFELLLRHARREQLRDAGAIEAPLARFRAVRWLRFPLKTFRAWSRAVEHGLTSPEEALAQTVSLEGMPKRRQLEFELFRHGWDLGKALDALQDRGISYDRSTAFQVRKELLAKQPVNGTPRQLTTNGTDHD